MKPLVIYIYIFEFFIIMSLFINFMAITNQKSTVDTQALKGKEFSYDIRYSHQVTREGR